MYWYHVHPRALPSEVHQPLIWYAYNNHTHLEAIVQLSLEVDIVMLLQGELRMWVDIFNKNGPIPNPVDISPRKPQKYVLRVVVYNVKDVKEFADENIFGEGTNDLYVEG